MLRIALMLTLSISVYSYAIAQSSEDSVKASIQVLFEGMKTSDAAMIRSAFSDSAILQSIGRTKQGSMKIINESVDAFAEAVSKMGKGDADERIEFETIKIDGPLAIVWTPYKFYYKGQFSHCGVNSFQLIRISGNWKIQYLIDTRRRDGCQ
jgi:hypothetical protein